MNRFIFLAIISVFIPMVVFTQSSVESEMAKKKAEAAIKDVKDGVLVFRLVSNYKKKEALKEILTQPDLDAKTELNIKNRLKTIELETNATNKMWMELLQYQFTLSEVLFTYDTTSAKTLNENDGKMAFLNEDLQIDPATSLNKRPYVMAYFGNTPTSSGTGIEAILFKNSAFEPLVKPFPYYIKRTMFTYYKNMLFNPEMAERRNIEKVAQKLNAALTDYYEDVF
ncbi:MAG: hypothetical protein KDC24_12930 [Saprospiraceae bacterium]|nr:hypothetical protein [Saprospiraceae bacterium]